MNIHDLLSTQSVAPIVQPPLPAEAWHVFDFSIHNADLLSVNLHEQGAFEGYINGSLEAHKAEGGVGGYLEPRVLYQRSRHFDGAEARSLHLGVDLWLPAYTPIYTPLPGRVHSFANNVGFANYGPTLILEHDIEGHTLYTLYGHMAALSIEDWQVGKAYAAGEKVGLLGAWQENGAWPPHLHFQVMTDMLGHQGDFPGVAPPSEKEYWAGLCPDPNLLLRMACLQ